MENQPEVQEPQKTPEAEAPKADVVTLSKKEFEDISHRADVSSQNFERLKKAEEELEALRSNLVTNDVPSEDDVGKLKAEIADIKARQAKSDVLETHPQLKEVWSEFEKFRSDPDNNGMNLKTAAKAFLVEKGLLEPQRKGLEKPTGGTRVPISSGMSNEDIKNLRETNYRKYIDMLKKGQLSI